MSEFPGLTQIGGIALIGNIIGLFSWTWIAITTFGFIAAIGVCAGLADRNMSTRPKVYEVGEVLLILSMFGALVAGVLVGGFGWIQFRHAAIVLIALFGIAVAILIAAKAFTRLRLVLIALFAVTLVLAVYMLPPPPGSPEREEWLPTILQVYVRTEAHGFFSGALICLDWKGEGEPDPPIRENCQRSHEGSATFWVLDRPTKPIAVLFVTATGFQPTTREVSEIPQGERTVVEISLQSLEFSRASE